MLEGIEARPGLDYFDIIREQSGIAQKVLYTGMIDQFYGYKLGVLQYRSTRFETGVLDTDNYRGNAVVNYTQREVPYTCIIEHKHFEFIKEGKTVISREYSSEWKPGADLHYPINDEKNGELYAQYCELAKNVPNVIFGGHLGEYKYCDMDKVTAFALALAKKELQQAVRYGFEGGEH